MLSLSLGYNNNMHTSSILLKSASLFRKSSRLSTSTLLYNHNNDKNIKTLSFNESMKSILPIINIKKTLSLFFNAIFIIMMTLIKPNKVLAAITTSTTTTTTLNKISGWDLFGRMPLDDWMFRTWALCDPNLLKKSYVEAIVFELPDVMANFKRRKRINEILTLGKGFGYLIGAICIAGIMYKGVLASQLKRVNQKGSDNYIPTSAISKKASRKGKQIDNMEGWLDMEQDADDDDDNDNSKDSKKKKRKDDDDDDD